ncbi:hypothetical protein QNI19_16390 [Cytophagaceae bacterium DM2B3-1]|uniref:CHAP domain-containing protein n=1 Tax=Xanthocytophaga flava TaxID=3048013 RepID=A0ABT7CNE5_9BACT|nr:hypothetical protein [Xanthocytophaga flavus]MDJ1494525.1 hypothetical protein [Xanthocytophaga flavus]
MRKILLYIIAYLILCYGNCFASAEILNSEFKPARLSADSVRLKLKQVFTSYVGTKELTGNNDGEIVESFLASVGLPKGYAWCAAFVKHCMDRVNVKTRITAWAPSAVPRNLCVWMQGKVIKRLPKCGDVFGVYYANLKRIGHVGFIREWKFDSPYAATTEGNTNSQNSREGNGVYERIRLKRQIHIVVNWIGA